MYKNKVKGNASKYDKSFSWSDKAYGLIFTLYLLAIKKKISIYLFIFWLGGTLDLRFPNKDQTQVPRIWSMEP